MNKQYYVYIMTNKGNSVLYTGITGNLSKRIYEHKEKIADGFTKRYNITKLVYFEVFKTPLEAIAVEKKIKGWTREKKILLIKGKNPEMNDIEEMLRIHSA
ncbi:MAG: GIY-YIG nuclease superfamily protein [Elusimicrobia bacterium ADurb.Bin231]|nr:MAG: GIY-YIG nuclease superfamily protein [Elusimicrobia bacterium ADurb.Bin231]